MRFNVLKNDVQFAPKYIIFISTFFSFKILPNKGKQLVKEAKKIRKQNLINPGFEGSSLGLVLVFWGFWS